jgi:hypothetical protein
VYIFFIRSSISSTSLVSRCHSIFSADDAAG